MNERLEIMLEFIHDFNSQTNGLVIPEPVTANELGYSVYNAVLNAPKLLIGNNRKITFDKKYQTFSNGFYRIPNNILHISFMYFEEKQTECSKAAQAIVDYLKNAKINNIVIHRDGFSNESDKWYEEYFSSKSIKYDLVEVKKNISKRLIDKVNSNGMNPKAGMCVIRNNEAIIVTTQRNADFGGAPQPFEIVHKHGSLTMEEIVNQIYTLSELHIGSIQSTRLPMTTYYADKICKAGNYIPKGNVYNKLYYLKKRIKKNIYYFNLLLFAIVYCDLSSSNTAEI